MRIDLNKNPNILREPKNHEDALARRAEILAELQEQDYVNPEQNPMYKQATEQVHELFAAKHDLRALKEEAETPLQELSPAQKRAAEVHKRALIAEYAARAPRESVAEFHIPVMGMEPAGVPVTVNRRDEVLTPPEVAELQAV